MALMWGFAFSLYSQEDKHLHPAPYPQFAALNLCQGDTATFINYTNGGVSYKWLLSSLDTSSNATQVVDSTSTTDYSYYFNTPGVFIVTLEADNGHLTSISKTVTVNNITKSSFEFVECSNQFINMSTCADQFLWDFGDGSTSNTNLPIHMYADTGFYQVKLISSKGSSIDTLIQTIYVDVRGYADPSFTISLTSNTLTGSVLNPIGPGLTVNWYLGDGSTATGTSVVHVYPVNAADYFINVMSFNECGMFLNDTAITIVEPVGIKEHSKEIKVSIQPNPASDKIQITADDILEISMINILGEIILNKKYVFEVTQESIELNTFPNGHYIVKVSTKRGCASRQIIKLN